MESVCTSHLLWHLLRTLIWNSFHSKDRCHLRFTEMFANCQIFVFSEALKKVSVYVIDLICIAQITRNEKQGIVDIQQMAWLPKIIDRELKQPRRRWRQEPHKFAYLTMKNGIFARFARAFFIFWHFVDVLVLSTTWNNLFCSCVDDVSKWLQMFNFVFSCSKRWFQFDSRIVRTHFSSVMSLNNWKMIAEAWSHIFRWRSCFRRRRVCLSSLLTLH